MEPQCGGVYKRPPQHPVSFSDCKTRQVDWNQVALDAEYKDGKNSRIMGGRLVKKLSEATAAAPPAADDGDNNNDDTGEGSSKVGARAVGKKRKAAGTTDDDGLPAKGKILARAPRVYSI